MGKGDVTMKFDAQTASFIQAVMNARNALDAGAEKSRQFGEDTAKAGARAEKAMKEASAAADQTKQAFLGVAGAVGGELAAAFTAAVEGAGAYVEKMKQIADLRNKSTQTVQGMLADKGQLGSFPDVSAQAKTIGGNVLGQTDVETTMAAIMQNMGGKINVDAAMKAARAAVQGKRAGVSDIAGFGTTAAQLGMVPSIAGQGEDATNEAAFQVFTHGGQLSDKEMMHLNRSKDKQTALDRILAARHDSETSKVIEGISQSAEEEISPREIRDLQSKRHHHPKKFTEEEARKLRLSAIPAEDREEAMYSDPTLAPEKYRRALGSLGETLATQRATAPNSLRGQIATNEGLKAGDAEVGALSIAEKIKRKAEREERAHSAEASEVANADAQVKLRMDRTAMEHPLLFNPAVRYVAEKFSNVFSAAGIRPVMDDDIQSQMKEQHEEHMDKLDEQNSVLRTRRDTSLSDPNKEGQK